jgi:hypothetical protein
MSGQRQKDNETGRRSDRKRDCALREYRFVLVVGLVALAFSSIPYVAGAAKATEERAFGGFVYTVADCYSYLAKMRQGAEGAWLFHVPYTPEPHPGTLFYPLYLLLGKVAALLPGGDLTARLVWTYHGARWLFGLALLLTVYRFLATLTARVAVRRLALVMATIGGGLGWLPVALGQEGWLGSPPLDFILPEGFTFLALYALPHVALGRALLLWGLMFLPTAWGAGRGPGDPLPPLHLGYAALAGLSWLLMGLVVPFYVPVAWAVTGSAWVVLGLRERRVAWREAGAAAIAALVSAPVVAYSAWVFTGEPVYAAWAAQNRILSPHPLHYLAAYGLLLLPASLAVRDAWRGRRPAWLALAWAGVVPLLVYLPFNLQRRLAEGVQIPLSLLAAMGVHRFGGRGVKLHVAGGTLLVALSLTNVMLVTGSAAQLGGQPAPIYRDADEIVAMDWLAGRAEAGDVILSAFDTGNYMPARVAARVFVGHGPETVRFAEKKELVARFFDATTRDDWRVDLLDEYGIDYVFWGPPERELGGFNPYDAGYLRKVFRTNGYAVFEVER